MVCTPGDFGYAFLIGVAVGLVFAGFAAFQIHRRRK